MASVGRVLALEEGTVVCFAPAHELDFLHQKLSFHPSVCKS